MYDWDRIQRLFTCAADLPPAEQDRFLETACGNDHALLRELQELLAADRQDIAGAAEAAIEVEAERLLGSIVPGDRVGCYKIVREIGRGGMGAVYMAVRDDDQFEKRVAIKIVKLGMDTAEVLNRFRHERQILANLDHPYIAHLLDGGTTSDGRPFFVMDYVEGQSLDEFCRRRTPSVKRRCRLFLRITDAVAYAHRNLVVHRDLKPANIFVTPAGLPKLLDFGVAKLLGVESGGAATITGSMLPLTPEYASPEQLAGETVTTATDIFSLGAVLYELLTGQRASAARRDSPALPSLGIDPDLYNIVLMAMRPEPERRYASVSEMAEDLRRYLEGWPVKARKDSVLYRARKFIYRRRLAVSAAALVALTGTVGLIGVVTKAHETEVARREAVRHQHAAEAEHKRAERERDMALQQSERAESEAQRAHDQLAQVLDFSNKSLADIDEMQRHPATLAARRQTTERTLEFLEQLSGQAGNDERLRAALATAYLRLGQSQSNVQSANARGVASGLESFRKGTQVIAPLVERSKNPEITQVWLHIQVETVKLLLELGHVDDARSSVRRAIAVASALNRRAPARDSLRTESYLYYLLAGSYEANSDFRQALVYSQQTHDSLVGLLKKFPEDPELLTDLSAIHTKLAFDSRMLGDAASALDHHKLSVEIREDLVKRFPDDVTYRRNLMLAYEHIAGLLSGPLGDVPGNLAVARQYMLKAGPLAEAALVDAPNHPSQFDYALYLEQAAELGVSAGGRSPVESAMRAAAMLESLVDAAPGIVKYSRELCNVEMDIAQRMMAGGRPLEAEGAFRKALAQADHVLTMVPADRQALVQSLNAQRSIATLLAKRGDQPGALEAAAKLVARAQAGLAYPLDTPMRQSMAAEAQVTLGSMHRDFRNWPQARAAAQAALAQLQPLMSGEGRNSYEPIYRQAEALLQSAAQNGQ